MTDTAWHPVFACPTCTQLLVPCTRDRWTSSGRGIPAGGVAPPSHIPDMLGRRALPAGRRAPEAVSNGLACTTPANGVPGRLECVVCGTSVHARGGIYRCLAEGRLAELRPFFDQYRQVRARDGYRPAVAEYYRALPDVRSGDPQADAWRLRACTYRRFVTRVLERLPVRSAAVLDLGAGNGWLSHRLSALGHRPVAVDWLDDDPDGLGAWRFYDRGFVCVQAEFDRLPFPPHQFDIVVFNGSLHYAVAVEATLRHAADRLTPGGALVVMDSPMFAHALDGEAMVTEKHRRFRTIYGMSDIIRPGAGYVTFGELERVGRDLGLRTRFMPSRAGLTWPLKRWVAALKIGRRPAAFGLWVAR